MLPFILRNESKVKLFSDQVVQLMENLESHGIYAFPFPDMESDGM